LLIRTIVCDAQCGSSNCLTTGIDKGLCSGCKQDSTSDTSSFFAYKQPVAGQKKYQMCITDCDHFGQLFGDISGDETGFCNGNWFYLLWVSYLQINRLSKWMWSLRISYIMHRM